MPRVDITLWYFTALPVLPPSWNWMCTGGPVRRPSLVWLDCRLRILRATFFLVVWLVGWWLFERNDFGQNKMCCAPTDTVMDEIWWWWGGVGGGGALIWDAVRKTLQVAQQGHLFWAGCRAGGISYFNFPTPLADETVRLPLRLLSLLCEKRCVTVSSGCKLKTCVRILLQNCPVMSGYMAKSSN